MRIVSRMLAVWGMLLLTCAYVHAGTIVFVFPIDGGQEAPPNGSTAVGTGTVTLDTDTNLLEWEITHDVAMPTLAHFHGAAPAGVNAGVQVNLGDPTSPIVGSTVITDPQKADLLAELWYVNIHSQAFPGGEIRGQVVGATAVPGLGTIALLILALILLAAVTIPRIWIGGPDRAAAS